jgi:hypothetical protein
VSSRSHPPFQTPNPTAVRPTDVAADADGTLARLGPVLDRFFRVAHVLFRRSRGGSLPGWIADAVDPGGNGVPAPLALPPLPAPELVLTERGLRLSRLGRPPLGAELDVWLRDHHGIGETRDPAGSEDARPLLERDAWMALLWSPALRAVWSRELRESNRLFLERLTPRCWRIDPTPLPHQAVLPGLGSRTFAASARPDLALRFPDPGGPEGPRETARESMTAEAWDGALRDAESGAAGAAILLREHVRPRPVVWEGSAWTRTEPGAPLAGKLLIRPEYVRTGDRIGLDGALAVLVGETDPGKTKRGEAILGVAPCRTAGSS